MFDKLKNIFSKQAEKLKSVAEFKENPILIKYVEQFSKRTLLLRPKVVQLSIPHTNSKMGGTPNLTGFSNYPKCSYCSSHLNFVFQLYKRDFPDFYFPDNKNLFQLFRCSNHSCSCEDYERFDQAMFHYYHHVDLEQPNPQFNLNFNETDEKMIPDCKLSPLETRDLPMSDTEEGLPITDMLDKDYDAATEDVYYKEYTAKTGTKIGGYPSWTQYPQYPICSCGKRKEFIFQFSSDEIDETGDISWAPHGIMIGDSGNIYYFYCPTCGEVSIESNWDCY